jgi:hypothetical protein
MGGTVGRGSGSGRERCAVMRMGVKVGCADGFFIHF